MPELHYSLIFKSNSVIRTSDMQLNQIVEKKEKVVLANSDLNNDTKTIQC